MRHQHTGCFCLSFLLLLFVVGCASADGSSSTTSSSPNISLSQLDLTKATIHSTLAALPSSDYVLLELFASWCPACRAFKPEYEKAAAFLLKHSSIHVYRLDCAVDPDVCDKYKVSGYPTMYVGKAADVAAVSVDKLSKFDYSLFQRNAAGVVKFASKHCALDLHYAEEDASDKLQSVTPKPSSTSANLPPAAVSMPSLQWTATDVQAATQQLFASITSFHPTEGLKERRAALVLLLQLWAAGHPLPQCRSGASGLLQTLPQLWPADAAKDPWGLESDSKAPTEVCAVVGQAAPSPAPYVACKGSSPESRGFTCGLWLLFHTTAARLPEKDGGALLVSALKGFAQHFFQCEVCRSHFVKITSTPEAAAVRSRRDGVIWLWRVHNEVNARLHQVESKYGHSSTGDPAFPKAQWPKAADCPLCQLPTAQQDSTTEQQPAQWNEEEVYKHLLKRYGGQPQGGMAAGSSLVVSGKQGGNTIMQAALAAEDAVQGGDGSEQLHWFSGRRGVLLVLTAGVVMLVLRHTTSRNRSNGRRHGYKGPGAHAPAWHGRGGTSWTK